MAVLSTNERTDHLNLSRDDIEADTKFFVETFNHLVPRLAELARKKYDSIFNREHANATHTNRLGLFLGFKSIVTKEKDHYDNDGNLIAHFFIHFFNWIWIRASEGERSAMEARLIGSLKDDLPLMAFFAEMATGFIYLQKKNRVEFLDLIPETRKCDLLVSNADRDLYVEVKSVSSEAGMPMTYRLISEGCNQIMRHVSELRERWPSFEISVQPIGKGEVKYDAAMKAAEDINSQLSTGKDRAENELWRVLVQRPTRLDMQKVYEVLKTGRAITDKGYSMVILDTHTPPRGFMGISIPQWDRSKPIEDACRVALQQMPEKGMKIVWVHMNGTPPGVLESPRQVVEHANINDRLARFIERQAHKTDRDPPLGVLLSPDPIAFWLNAGKTILSLQFPAGLITHRSQYEKAALYAKHFWKFKEGDVGTRMTIESLPSKRSAPR